MGQRVALVSDGHRVEGCGPDGEFVNRFLAHLESWAFSSGTDMLDYPDWQQHPAGQAGPARRRVRGGTGDDEPADRRGARPAAGQPLTEAGLRRIFRTHRLASGALRVRPHRLRHTYGTELTSAAIDLLALRELMGHVNPETTAAYVHLSPETLAGPGAGSKTLNALRVYQGGPLALRTC